MLKRKSFLRIFSSKTSQFEYCFNVEVAEPLEEDEINVLFSLLVGTGKIISISTSSFLSNIEYGQHIVEVGLRLNFETSFSTNAVAICHACGLTKVARIERSRRYWISDKMNRNEFIRVNHDRMTECEYTRPLETFVTNVEPAKVETVNMLEFGVKALANVNSELGLGMDEWDLEYYTNLFVNEFGRNPTDVECFQLGQANSEHSRHWYFNAKQVIDGQEKKETLFGIVRSPLESNRGNSLIAFSDNSSVMEGFNIETILPENPGQVSSFVPSKVKYHSLFTAETHNHPSGIAPVPGAETGTGGRIRDTHATGRGSLVGTGTVGFCVGDLNIPGYHIPGEKNDRTYPANLAKPLDIFLGMIRGSFDYGNKFGEPVTLGFVRTGELDLPNGERRGWLKPIMFTGGLGQIDDRHLKKVPPQKGMLIVQIGGPAFCIGMGGGAASSMIHGENKEELDFASVQRGDPEMKNKVNRGIRTCVEMGDDNPILSIHDQGAGGPCNVITEISEPAGGRIDIRKIVVGDPTMSILEIWGCEYQERDALLIDPNRIDEFIAICKREKVNCEVLGEITDDGRIVVEDSRDGTTPVNLELSKILADLPQKTFESTHAKKVLKPFEIPDLSVEEFIQMVFKLPSVGSKGYLTRQVDRSVTGLVAQQQCCGPLQLAVSDCAVTAQSHFGLTGAVKSIGEEPIKMLVDSAAGARMAVAEPITNMAGVVIIKLSSVRCSVNWMAAPKLPHGGAEMYDAAVAMRDVMLELGIAVDGGKDSLSMATKVDGEIVKSPMQMVVSAYASVPDITKVVTPDIKRPGESELLFVSLGCGKWRLGGSALAQACGQIGNEVPDLENTQLLVNAFNSIQSLIKDGLILAIHDISDGGLITTIAEMVMAGNCGADINHLVDSNIELLFAEELGWVIEYLPENRKTIIDVFSQEDNCPDVCVIGETSTTSKLVLRNSNTEISTWKLRAWWESTSDAIEVLQMNPDVAKEQVVNRKRKGSKWNLTFDLHDPYNGKMPIVKVGDLPRPKVAIIREEGSNGDREMISAFYSVGFDVKEIPMIDLQNGKASLDDFRGIAFVGGFSYGDVLGSAVGWAGVIQYHSELQEMFDRFYHRTNTFSLGVCNGCQLMTQLGWVTDDSIAKKDRPVFVENRSERFESRFVAVRIKQSSAMMFDGMEGSVLGVWIANREGRFYSPKDSIIEHIAKENCISMAYVDDDGNETEEYPYNPNGSLMGVAGLCSPNGRHLAIMPHPERLFRTWQFPWIPKEYRDLKVSPWLRMFQNAYTWCM